MNKDKILNLINKLNKASDDYYNNRASMSDHEFDKLYDELKKMEEESGIIFPFSPTQNVGYEISKELEKEKHDHPMLSLDKTKDREVLKDFLLDKEGILSYKMDGLTIVLTYDNGELIKGVTRGNGEIGELITNNIKAFENVPIKIDYKGHLVLRGEAIITYSDFEKINEEVGDNADKFKNPRNLCSAAVRQLDPQITKNRHVKLFAFSLEEYDEQFIDEKNKEAEKKSYKAGLEFLKNIGFDIVTYKEVNQENIIDTIEEFSKDVTKVDFPTDGLVLIYDDKEYGKSLGTTSKFPRNAMAFKWQDEIAQTTLREVEWSLSRTGLINPIAIFDPVSLEGTIVKRASLHNVSIMRELELGIGDKITVYKANMIIPQIDQNLTKSNNIKIPENCPICNTKTVLKNENSVETLICPNEKCPVKHLKQFEHFVSRNAFNLEGISIATLDTLIQQGFIKEYSDIYHLDRYKENIIKLDGFGEKSYNNIIKAVESVRTIALSNFINALGISGIGIANSKILSKYYNNDINKIINATEEELAQIDEIGPVLAKSIYEYFLNKENLETVNKLLKEVNIIQTTNKESLPLQNKIFVITGSLNNFENRDELVKVIEENGGKSSSSVSKNTNYLINNDINSASAKNKKARDLGVKIISEEEFLQMIK